MFNPAKFSTPEPKTIPLGNSAHPVMEHIEGNSFRKVPVANYDLYYVELKMGFIVTYRKSDKSMQLHELTLEQFKHRVKEGLGLESRHEIITAPENAKYLGNTLMDIINCEVKSLNL